MTMIPSYRRLSFGINCLQCDNELIAPERSEYRNERQIRHLWHCPKCDCSFEVIRRYKSTQDYEKDRRYSHVAVASSLGQFGEQHKATPRVSRHAARLDFRGFACLLASANC